MTLFYPNPILREITFIDPDSVKWLQLNGNIQVFMRRGAILRECPVSFIHKAFNGQTLASQVECRSVRVMFLTFDSIRTICPLQSLHL